MDCACRAISPALVDAVLPVLPTFPLTPTPLSLVVTLPVAPTPPTLPLAVRVVPVLERVADVSPDTMPPLRLRLEASCGLIEDPRTMSFTSPIRLPDRS